MALQCFVACQTTAIDLEIHFHSSPYRPKGHFMVSSLLSTVFNVQREFPQKSLIFALLRLLHLQIWSSLNSRFQGKAGLTQNWNAPLQGWIGSGSLAARGPLSKFGLSLRYWLCYRSFHLVKSGHMWKILSQAQSLVSRACVMTGFGSKFCGQKCVL